MSDTITIEVCGGVCGLLWMPAVTGWIVVCETFSLRGPDYPSRPSVDSIREALEVTISRNDGDFQDGGRLTGDTFFTIKRRQGNRSVARTYRVEQFPLALVDLVNGSVFSTDGMED